jgi:hypothetical protein
LVAIDKRIEMLRSPKASTRFEACELLRVAPKITPEETAALRNALRDPDSDVVERAKSALAAHSALAGTSLQPAEADRTQAAPGPSSAASSQAVHKPRPWWLAPWFLWPILFSLPWSLLLLAKLASSSGDRAPSWSPDGARIAFISNRDGDWHLYAVDPDGSNLQLVSDLSVSYNTVPQWSPNNRWIAIPGADGCYSLIQVSTGTPMSLPLPCPATLVEWSPDGSWLLGVANGAWTVVDVATGQTAGGPITGGIPLFSPDGTRVAYAAGDDLFVATLELGQLVELTSGARYRLWGWTAPTWSPDGEHLATFCDEGLCILDSDDGDTIEIQIPGEYPSLGVPQWSPTGRHVVAGRGNTLSLVDVNTRSVRVLADSFEFLDWYSLLPDGASVMFAAHNTSADLLAPPRILIVDITSGATTPLFSTLQASVSPDGRQVAFTVGDRYGEDIFLADLSGTARRKLIVNPTPLQRALAALVPPSFLTAASLVVVLLRRSLARRWQVSGRPFPYLGSVPTSSLRTSTRVFPNWIGRVLKPAGLGGLSWAIGVPFLLWSTLDYPGSDFGGRAMVLLSVGFFIGSSTYGYVQQRSLRIAASGRWLSSNPAGSVTAAIIFSLAWGFLGTMDFGYAGKAEQIGALMVVGALSGGLGGAVAAALQWFSLPQRKPLAGLLFVLLVTASWAVAWSIISSSIILNGFARLLLVLPTLGAFLGLLHTWIAPRTG